MNSQELVVTVGLADTKILPANPKRTVLLINNLGANDVYWSLSGLASVDGGQVINPGQRPIRISRSEYGARIEQPLHMIAITGAVQVAITEGFT